MSYVTGEAAGNNAFFSRALTDGAFLARRIGRSRDAGRLDADARQLYDAFNRSLWMDSLGSYAAAAGSPVLKPGDTQMKKSFTLRTAGGLTEPTFYAGLFALDRGIVPAERRARVTEWTLAHDDQQRQVMGAHFYFKLLYSLDTPAADQRVLDRMRRMLRLPLGGGASSHCLEDDTQERATRGRDGTTDVQVASGPASH